MKKIVCTVALALIATGVLAQGLHPETTDQSRTRHDSAHYQGYPQKNLNQEPPGGYSYKLGDPAPASTLRPGESQGLHEDNRQQGYGLYGQDHSLGY